MSVLSPRLMRRIQQDFPHHDEVVLRRLESLAGMLEVSDTPERILGAVVRVADGRLDRLHQAVELARTDWRDILVAADLANADWPDRLTAWLGPDGSGARPDPITTGELVESDGRRWVVRRRRIDLRMVKRLIQRGGVTVLVGGSGGSRLCRVEAADRSELWEKVRRSYAGRGRTYRIVGDVVYQGHEFVDDQGSVMLYLEKSC